MIRLIAFIVLLIISKNLLACFPQQWTLEKQIETATKIALVEVIVTEAEFNQIQAIQVKVLTNVKNTVEAELITFLNDDGMDCGKIGLDKVGQQAIILIEPAPHSTLVGEGYYWSVNISFSVYHVVDGEVRGLAALPLTTIDAVEKIRDAVNGAIWLNSYKLYIPLVGVLFILVAFVIYKKSRNLEN